MYSVSQDVKSAFLGGNLQDLRISFADEDETVLTALGGDIEASGAEFSHLLNSSEDLHIGETPAASFSVTLMNLDRQLSGFEFGEAYVEIGVCMDMAHTETAANWEWVPMGYYFIGRPERTRTETIEIRDALDRMRLFDVDAAPFLAYITDDIGYPLSIRTLTQELCDYVGLTLDGTITDYPDYTINRDPFPTSCTLRDILHWIAEKWRKCARINRDGELQFFWIGSATESVPATRILQDSETIAEYQTEQITQSVIKNMAGLSYISGNPNSNVYYVLGNPFMQDADASLLTFVQTFPLYVPLSCSLTEADPTIDCGDMISIGLSDEQITALVDSGVALTDGSGNVLTIGTSGEAALNIPLMGRTLRWNGRCTADYIATGNRIRELEDETDYAVNSATSEAGVIEKVKAHGIIADWIKTGLLKSINDLFEINLDTGEIIMKSAQLLGGLINIESESAIDNIIKLYAPAGGGAKTKALFRGAVISVEKYAGEEEEPIWVESTQMWGNEIVLFSSAGGKTIITPFGMTIGGSSVATQDWVNLQKFIKNIQFSISINGTGHAASTPQGSGNVSIDLGSGFATEAWVDGKGYITKPAIQITPTAGKKVLITCSGTRAQAIVTCCGGTGSARNTVWYVARPYSGNVNATYLIESKITMTEVSSTQIRCNASSSAAVTVCILPLSGTWSAEIED